MADLSLFVLHANYFTDNNLAAYRNHVRDFRENVGDKLRDDHL